MRIVRILSLNLNTCEILWLKNLKCPFVVTYNSDGLWLYVTVTLLRLDTFIIIL